jgi:hypothetical protein
VLLWGWLAIEVPCNSQVCCEMQTVGRASLGIHRPGLVWSLGRRLIHRLQNHSEHASSRHHLALLIMDSLQTLATGRTGDCQIHKALVCLCLTSSTKMYGCLTAEAMQAWVDRKARKPRRQINTANHASLCS